MKWRIRRKTRDSSLYAYGVKLIYSMGILFALSAFANPSLITAIIVIVLTGSLL